MSRTTTRSLEPTGVRAHSRRGRTHDPAGTPSCPTHAHRDRAQRRRHPTGREASSVNWTTHAQPPRVQWACSFDALLRGAGAGAANGGMRRSPRAEDVARSSRVIVPLGRSPPPLVRRTGSGLAIEKCPSSEVRRRVRCQHPPSRLGRGAIGFCPLNCSDRGNGQWPREVRRCAVGLTGCVRWSVWGTALGLVDVGRGPGRASR